MFKLLMTAPNPLPLGIGPLVPKYMMPTGTTYKIDANGQISAFSLDVGILIGLGFKTPPDAVISRSVSLTADDINHLHSAPKQILPAPGAGKVNVFVAPPVISVHVGTIPFGGSQNDPVTHFEYAISHTSVGATSFQTLQEPESAFAIIGPSTSTDIPYANAVNQAIVLTHGSPDFVTAGAIVAKGVTSGQAGLGYAANDTGTLSGSISNTPPGYTITSVGAGGAVTGFIITGDMGGNEVQNGIATSVSTGAGDGNLQIDVTAITPGNGSGQIDIIYQTITLP